jgi:dihydroxyacetone kinase
MKKFLNQAENFIPEMLEGIYLAHPDKFRCVNEDLHCLATARPVPGKVGIVTGGGSGHLPLFLGYVGQGMLDGCAIGDVFQSPSPEQILAVTQAVDSGAGVLYLYGNYNGDIFNFDMAAEMADMESDIRTATVVAADDSAGAVPDGTEATTRRGVAGSSLSTNAPGHPRPEWMTLKPSSALRRKQETACARLASRCRRVSCRESVNRVSILATTKWRLAWGFTAKAVFAGVRSSAPNRLPKR